MGLAISEGKLALDDKVVSFFPDKLPEEVSDNLAAMTIRDLLTMTCGHQNEPSARYEEGADWVEGFLAHPVPHAPGTYYMYNSFGTYMLSAILQKVTGEKVVDYLDTRLFQPLHIDKPEWDESPQGINCGGWGLNITTEDMAKLGQLLLQGGEWNGRHGAFRADGAFGQYIIVFPEKDAVIVLTTQSNLYQPYLDIVWDKLLPAIE